MSQASRHPDSVSFVSPAGVRLSGPPGLLQALVGIAANESGWDYFRNQGSPPGSIEAAPKTAEEAAATGGGYGEYQFQWGTDQYNRAAAAGWSPAAQDEIAAEMMTGYFNTWHRWDYVAEAWYGPGTVPQEPIAANSVADVQNVMAEEAGHGPLPAAWVFGDYKGGLTAKQVKREMGGGVIAGGKSPSTKASLTSFPGGSLDPLNLPGEAASATASAVTKSLLPLLLEGAFVALGAGLVIVGGYLAAGKKLPSIEAALPALAAA